MINFDTALILAAGVGNRLHPHTKKLPKCLLEIAGRPILAYQLQALLSVGIKNAIIVIGFEGSKIVNYVNNSKFKGQITFTFIENKEYVTSNSSYSFFLAKNLIAGKNLIYLHSDLVFFSPLLKLLLEDTHSDVIIVDKNIKLDNTMQQIRIERGYIDKMTKNPQSKMYGKACGIAKFSPRSIHLLLSKIAASVQKGEKDDWFYNFIGQNLPELKIYGLEKKHHLLLEVNTKRDLALARTVLTNLDDQ